MKRVFALLFFLMLPLVPLGAQGLHGKIFVLGESNMHEQYPLEALLPSIYTGVVDSGLTLPQNLSGYDAILDFQASRFSSDTISFPDQVALINYITNGGRFYAQGFPFLRSNGNVVDKSDSLIRYLGDQSEICEDVQVWWIGIYGIDSDFTDGISISWTHPDPTQFDGSPCGIIGNVVPVLLEQEGNFGVSDPIAWVPSNHAIRAVLTSSAVPEIFYTRLLCDYFGLCVDAVKGAPPSIPSITLRVVSDGVSTSLLVSSEEGGTLDVANALGVTVYRVSISSGTSRIELPELLRNGVYFARLRTERGGQVQPFAIVAK